MDHHGGKSTWYTVMAVTDPEKGANGISAFMVHKDDPGFSVGALERSSASRVRRRRSCISRTARSRAIASSARRGPVHKTALQTLDHTPARRSVQAVGIAQGALDKTIAYVKDRKQFGKSISQFQGVEFMIADNGDEHRPPGDGCTARRRVPSAGRATSGFISSASKCFASDVAMKVTTDAVQLFGGAGLHP